MTEAEVRGNVSVALQYLDQWLRGTGAAAINDLMEDAATAEIARAQLWQWVRHGARLDDGRAVTAALYAAVHDEELARLWGAADRAGAAHRYPEASALLRGLVTDDAFVEFLTLPAYGRL